jgi:hypothetical protein
MTRYICIWLTSLYSAHARFYNTLILLVKKTYIKAKRARKAEKMKASLDLSLSINGINGAIHHKILALRFTGNTKAKEVNHGDL